MSKQLHNDWSVAVNEDMVGEEIRVVSAGGVKYDQGIWVSRRDETVINGR